MWPRTTRSPRSSPGSRCAPSPKAPNTNGCAARSPTAWRASTPVAYAATSTGYSNRLVNDFCREGRVELVSQFAERLPMMVMCADHRHAGGVQRPSGAGRPRHDAWLGDRGREQRLRDRRTRPAGPAPSGGPCRGLRHLAGRTPRRPHRQGGQRAPAGGSDRRLRDDHQPDRQRAAHGPHRPQVPGQAQWRAHDRARGGRADAVGRAALHLGPRPLGRWATPSSADSRSRRGTR